MSWRNRILTVDSRLLLAFYGIIPLLLVVAALDVIMFEHSLRNILPKQPETYLWWTVIFNLPHIMASFVTYADNEYLKAYRWPLSFGLLLAAGLTLGLPLTFGPLGLLAVGAVYTMYHVLMQQYGISLMLLKRPPNPVFLVWRWMTIAAASMIYLEVYFPALRQFVQLPVTLDMIGTWIIIISAPVGGIFLYQVLKSEASLTAKLYFLGTYLMIYTSCAFYHWGYVFFLFLIPRFVHDATAFTVYAVHDHNRNLVTPHNWIYRVLKPLHISPVILCLPLGIGIAWVLTVNQQNLLAAFFISVFAFLHYYMEGHMWKRNAPHRQNLSFYSA